MRLSKICEHKINKESIKKFAINFIKSLLWFISGAILAAVSFGSVYAWHLVLTAAVPLIWIKAPTRYRAWLFVFAYYLFAAHDIPIASEVFFGCTSKLAGLGGMLWIISALLLSLPWEGFWVDYRFYEKHELEYYPKIKNRYCAMVINIAFVLFFVTVPPLGLFGWANPILGYVWLPFMSGFGFTAIIIGILLTVFVAEYTFRLEENSSYKKQIIVAKVIIVLFFAFLYLFDGSPTAEDMNAMANDTIHMHAIQSRENKLYSATGNANNAQQLQAFLKKYVNIKKDNKIIILPETVCGTLDSEKIKIIQQYIQSSINKDVVIYAGAQRNLDDKKHYENGLFCFDSSGLVDGAEYIQRVPMIISAWQPWGSDYSCKTHFSDRGVIKIGMQRAAGLICYEQLLAFPVFMSFIHLPFTNTQPTMILAVSNQWWSEQTNIPAIQTQCVLTWCRLFGVPAVTAENKAAKK